jgi:polysaccharide export outer membrane protein
LCLLACASGPSVPVAVGPSAQPDATLGPGDTFEVSVYGEADLSGKYRVSEDGTINFPLVGRIPVAGTGPGGISKAIEQALVDRKILRDPHVSVFLLEQTSKQISVIGAVAKPGTVPLASGMTAIQAIGAVGGMTALASGNNTIVTRRVDGQLRRFKVQIDSISEGRSEDFELRAGDIVFVPERVF